MLLSEIVRELRKASRLLQKGLAGFCDLAIEEQALCVLDAAGYSFQPGKEALLNLAVHALLATDTFVVHTVRPAAASLVVATDLRSVPTEPPRLMREPWLVEGHKGQSLVADISAVGGYGLDDLTYLFVRHGPRGEYFDVAGSRFHWGPENADPRKWSVLTNAGDIDPSLRADWAKTADTAAAFALVLGLLLDAKGSPLKAEEDAVGGGHQTRAQRQAEKDHWRVRHVRLAQEEKRSGPAIFSGPIAPAVPGFSSTLVPKDVPVSGHLRRFRVGAGRAKVDWRYVREYSATRWYSTQPQKVVVHA